MKSNRRRKPIPDEHNTFLELCMFVGGGAVLGSLFFGTAVPIIVVGMGLLITLAFFNGLGA